VLNLLRYIGSLIESTLFQSKYALGETISTSVSEHTEDTPC